MRREEGHLGPLTEAAEVTVESARHLLVERHRTHQEARGDEHVRVEDDARRGYAVSRSGPARRTASETFSRYFSKLSANISASWVALAS